jgi:hypothetical protein
LGAKADDWADPDYLHLKQDDINRLEVNGLVLELQDGKWQLAGLAAGETADAEQILALVRQVARLDFLAILGSEPGTGYGPEVKAQHLAIGLKSGEPRQYDLWKPEGQTYYVLKSGASPFYFKLADYGVRDLAGAARDKLVKAKPAATPEPEPAASSAAPAAEAAPPPAVPVPTAPPAPNTAP